MWFYGEQSCMWVAPEQMELLGSYKDLTFGLRLTALRHWGRKQLKCAQNLAVSRWTAPVAAINAVSGGIGLGSILACCNTVGAEHC